MSNINIQAKDTVFITGNSRIDAESRIGAGVSSTVYDKRIYYLCDHLSSVKVVLNDSGNVIAYTDYYPFGLENRSMSNINEPKEGSPVNYLTMKSD